MTTHSGSDRSPTNESPPEQLLIYDGECRLCVTAKNGLERLHQRGRPGGPLSGLRFVAYQSEEAACRLASEYRAGRPEVAYLVGPDGTVQRGLDAFLPLLPGLPGGRLWQLVMQVPVLRPFAKLLYRLVARYRYRVFGQVPYRPEGRGGGAARGDARAGRSGSVD